MVQKLKAKDLTVSEMPARRNIEVLFADKATDQRDEEEEGVVENSGYRGEAAQQRQKSRRVLSPKAVAA
jgi:hypothetical protein